MFHLSLQLADDALILGHRNSEWTGHGPNLEQDIAISNIALDQIGQARNFYQYAAECCNHNRDAYTKFIQSPAFRQVSGPIDEDDLAYLRDAMEFRNHLLAELPKGDWAVTVTRQFFMSLYQQLLYTDLQHSLDKSLGAIAEKSLKEVNYHVRWSGEWVIRLGDGTEESHQRMEAAIGQLWPYAGELFMPADYQLSAVEEGFLKNPEAYKEPWLDKVGAAFTMAGLSIPALNWHQKGGKQGIHTEHLGYLLAEMQYLQRSHPGAEW
jgi:ring-1,2-phenylacetyl-CoA epoxidase subunit PaaC